MKSEKLQVYALKAMLSGSREIIHGTLKDGRVAIGNGYFLGIIPAGEVRIRFDKEEHTTFREKFDPYDIDPAYELAEPKYFVMMNILKYKTASGKYTYIDRDYLKYFDKDCALYIKDSKSPCLVFEGDLSKTDSFVGVICPVNWREEDDPN